MHPEILRHRDAIAELCRRYGVARLEVFGSAARGEDFDPARSDVDLLVEFGPGAAGGLDVLVGLHDALQAEFGRPVDVVERRALMGSYNYIRRRSILSDLRPLYPD